jgi:hypothetical protein
MVSAVLPVRRGLSDGVATIELRKTWEASIAHIIPCIETRDMRDTFAISIVSVLCDM